MKVTGIIAEYNPFHNGHLHHLQFARRLTSADYLVVVMSGDFVQRGAPALADKFVRARMALACGADLVLELPVWYATGSAEYFAEGAVTLLDSLQVVDSLCFGSECGDLAALEETAGILAKEPPLYREALQTCLKNGCTFPAAREQALRDYLSSGNAPLQDGIARKLPEGLLSRPNNILAIEYLKAIARTGSSIKPEAIPRIGDYHGTALENPEGFASASAIREALANGYAPDELSPFLPEASLSLLCRALDKKPQPFLNDYSAVLHYLLLSIRRPEELMVYQDAAPDLANRIFALRDCFRDVEGFIRLLKSRQYTWTRISRFLVHILLDLKESDTEKMRRENGHSFLRVLGFRKESAALLSAIKEKSALPLITRLADAPVLLPESSFKMLEKNLFASSVYHMTDPLPDGKEARTEYAKPVVLL